MKRLTQLALACMLVLSVVPLVAAQQVPQPVVRLGDWVEVAPEVFMNWIVTTDIRYQTVENYDFENRIQDRPGSRDPHSTVPHGGDADILWEESRIGVDVRYLKNLKMQVLFEQQATMDGNTIDQTVTPSPGPAVQTYSNGGDLLAAPSERNTVNLERFWIDYTFPVPVEWLRMRVGADLWYTDQAGVLGDDDPRFALFATFGPQQEWEFEAAAVIQSESLRIGLENDNDFVYYTFGAAYNMRPFRFALNGAYFKDRFQGAKGQTATNLQGQTVSVAGQKIYSTLLMPSVTGVVGPISFLAQGMVVFGTADGSNITGSQEFDIFSWGFAAQAEANLGIIRPFLGMVYGSGDSDPTDNDLKGFAPLPQGEITLMSGTKYFAPLDTAASWGARDVASPARSRNPVLAGAPEFRHTVGNPFSDRIGRTAHVGINTTYSNPGTIMPFVGIAAVPWRGHEVSFTYIYTRLVSATILSTGYGRRIDEGMYMEGQLQWQWTISPYFDIRLTGGIIVPQRGAQDIANTVNCNPQGPGFSPCAGENLALKGEARFRARF